MVVFRFQHRPQHVEMIHWSYEKVTFELGENTSVYTVLPDIFLFFEIQHKSHLKLNDVKMKHHPFKEHLLEREFLFISNLISYNGQCCSKPHGCCHNWGLIVICGYFQLFTSYKNTKMHFYNKERNIDLVMLI